MPNILITGCSSGFGLAAARHFLAQGWNVIATMRRPDPSLFDPSDRLRVMALDVTDEASIAKVVAAAGPIDALVNNAGIGWMNAVEATSMAKTRELFETNTFGTIALTQAVVPQMRERGAGVIVNVSSSTTQKPLRFLSAYSASKAAINQFTEVMAIELEPFGIRVRLVIPGRSPATSFARTAQTAVAGAGGMPPAYQAQFEQMIAAVSEADPALITHPEDVTEAIWRAVTDPSTPVRIPAGADSVALEAALHNRSE